jgi:hypothetical protein
MSLVRPITRRDIKGPALYTPIRDDYRARVTELKQARRVLLGDRVEIVFDNRLTLTMQIEEICRLENLNRDDQIQAEIDLTNELMPTDDSLAATVFVAVPQEEDARVALRDLVGLDEHVVLHIGARAIRAAFEPGRSTEDRISAVQYARFPLDAAAKAALRTPGTPVVLEIDHPNYRHRVACPDALRAALAADYEPVTG